MKATALRLLRFWGPLAGYALVIFWLSSMSHPPVPAVPIPHFDKLLHLIEYAGFGALMCRALAMGGEGLSPRAAVLAAALLGAIYGASDELHQAFVPNRDSSLFDLLADIGGATLGGLAYWAAALRGHGSNHKVRTDSGGPPAA